MSNPQEPNRIKPKLAIISSYDDLCGNASYTRSLERNLSTIFEVTVLNLITNPAIRLNKAALDKNIDDICKKLPDFDVVNIQFESALFGTDTRGILARVRKLINASQNLILTFHRVDVKPPLALRALASHLGRFELLSVAKELFFRGRSGDITKAVNKMLLSRPESKPYKILVHRYLDEMVLQTVYHQPKENILTFPLVYFSNDDVEKFRQSIDVSAWRARRGIPKDMKLIGVFGFLGQYKGFSVAVEAIKHLPDEYGLAIVGGQHPMNILPMQVDPTVTDLQNLLIASNENNARTKLMDRVFFLGTQPTDEAMTESMLAVDYVVLPYYEVGQSASGIASMALELGTNTILSKNIAFMELEKFFPNTFESFDIGNALELRHKIMHYDVFKIKNRQSVMSKFSAERLAQTYYSAFKDMKEHD